MAAEHAAWISDLLAELTVEDRRALFRLLGRLKQSVRAGLSRGGHR
jgi:hypothetical protein